MPRISFFSDLLSKRKKLLIDSFTIKNKKIAQELERATKKNSGFLTLEEFLQLDQFGKQGYHANHTEHGETKTHEKWSYAIATLCKERGYKHVIEFGPGNGDLAIRLLEDASEKNHFLTWSGIEIDNMQQKKIRNRFREEGLHKHFRKIYSKLENISIKKESVVIFSYSIDSIPPEVFINTSTKKVIPNAVLGVSIEKDKISEMIVSPDLLKQKNASLTKGIYKRTKKIPFNLRDWTLYPGQRACIPIAAFSLLAMLVKKAPPNTLIIVIDEFRQSSSRESTKDLCLPKYLYKRIRDCKNFESLYSDAGTHLLYYPIYLKTFQLFLHTLGLNLLAYDADENETKTILNKDWIPQNYPYTTYAFLTPQHKKSSINPIKIPLIQNEKH